MDVRTMSTLFALLTVIADVSVLAIAVIGTGARWPGGLRRARDGMCDLLSETGLWLAWLVALTATLGSLYYSEVAHFLPCKLCWFQRIGIYPLAVVLLIAALRRDRAIRFYAIPVAAISAAISTYHYQLERFPNQASPSCSVEAPCTVVWVWRFHYISIPMMALSAALLVIALLWATGRGDPARWKLEDPILPDPGWGLAHRGDEPYTRSTRRDRRALRPMKEG
ncbi:MAG: disulfide bond formation protein B [Actinomycetota bacterium]